MKPIVVTGGDGRSEVRLMGSRQYERLMAIANMLLIASPTYTEDSVVTIERTKVRPPNKASTFYIQAPSFIDEPEVKTKQQYKRWPGDTRNDAGPYINRKKKKRK